MWTSKNHGMFYHDAYFYQPYKKGYIKRYLGFIEKNTRCFYYNNNYYFYLDCEELALCKDGVERFYLSSRYEAYIKDVTKEINNAKRYRRLDIYSLSTSKLKTLLKTLLKRYEVAAALYTVSEPYYMDLLTRDINIDIKDLKPYKMPSIIKEEKEWAEMVLNNEVNSKSISEHIDRYSYLFNSFNSCGLTVDTLEKRLLNRNDLSKRYRTIKKAFKRRCNNGNLLLDRLSKTSYYRMELRPTWMAYSFLIDKILKKLYPNVNYINYSVDEVLNEQFDKREDRSEFYFFRENEVEKLFYNHTYRFNKKKNSLKLLKGQYGYGSKLCGIALVKQTPSFDENEISSGTVLVIPQLTYDYVPYLDKIKGIVVDEGGITSHANIIARELGISIIVGTIDGTRLIKSGDYINANMETYVIQAGHK